MKTIATIIAVIFMICVSAAECADHNVSSFGKIIFKAPNPKYVYVGSPGLAVSGSRLIATFNVRGSVLELSKKLGYVSRKPDVPKGPVFSRIYISDDKGHTWKYIDDFNFTQARPFTAGDNNLYIIGQRNDLVIMRSSDNGESWGDPVDLTKGEFWTGAPCNVWYSGKHVYLAFMKRLSFDVDTLPVSEYAPVLMRAETGADLTDKKSWTFASELPFKKALNRYTLNSFGIPFYSSHPHHGAIINGRRFTPIGWLEPNVVQVMDKDHIWYDESFKTFHVIMRAHTGLAGYCAMVKVVEKDDGTMETSVQKAPSGKDMIYSPMPGGHLKFHVVYDKRSSLYWLASSRSTDSMRRPDRLSGDRYGLAFSQRREIALYFSKNLVDWSFAGIIDKGETERQARSYPCMVIDGEDLHILTRSGDGDAKSSHDCNITKFHTVSEFRKLIY